MKRRLLITLLLAACGRQPAKANAVKRPPTEQEALACRDAKGVWVCKDIQEP